jgi:hypothetical protein
MIGFLDPRIAVEIGLMRVVHHEQFTCGESAGNALSVSVFVQQYEISLKKRCANFPLARILDKISAQTAPPSTHSTTTRKGYNHEKL